jgi:hypothetical protein
MKSTFLSNLHYFFAKTDGSYDIPNSADGDLLKTAKAEIEILIRGQQSLVKTIRDAERKHSEACLNGTIAQQVAASSTVETLKFALAVVTGTAVGGAQFNAILKANVKDQRP